MNRIVIIIVLLISIYYLYEESIFSKNNKYRLNKLIKELRYEKNNLKEIVTNLEKELKESKEKLDKSTKDLVQINEDLKELNNDILINDSIKTTITKEKSYKEKSNIDILEFDNTKNSSEEQKEEQNFKIKPEVNYDKKTKEITIDGLQIELKQKF